MWHQAVQTAPAMQAQVVLAREAKAVNAKATLLQAVAVHRAQAPNMYVRRAALRVHLLRAITAAALPAAAIIETTAQAAHITEATRQVAATIAAAHLQEVPRQAQAAALAATAVAAAQVQAQV